MGNYISPTNEYRAEDPRKHHQQRQHQQQHQHRQQQVQQKHRRLPHEKHPISTWSTLQLLYFLEEECQKTIEIIRSMKLNTSLDTEMKRYILQILLAEENKLRRFNLDMESNLGQISDAEREIRRLQREIQKLEDDNRRLEKSPMRQNRPVSEGNLRPAEHPKQGNRSDREKLAEAISYGERLKRDLEDTIRQNEELSRKVDIVSEEKRELVLSLNKFSEQMLTKDNPAIADLSDPNRPSKLGEIYSEMYDNEWADAYEGLTNAGYVEEDAIMTLQLTLLNVFQFCDKKSTALLKQTEEAVNALFEEFKDTKMKNNPRHLTMQKKAQRWGKLVRRSSIDGTDMEVYTLQTRWKPKQNHEVAVHDQSLVTVKKPEAILNQLKVFRKEVAESMVPLVQKAYLSASWDDRECINTLKPFIKKCIILCWMMVVQSPPMVFKETNPGENFSKDIFKEYTASGKTISYVVWPALLLNQDGPVVGKGVAQGTNN